MKYNIIYCDPPWNYKNATCRGGAKKHYKTTDDSELQTMNVQNLAADNCMCFMWATYPKLQDALDLMKAWGFEYKTVAFTWIKMKGCEHFTGMGFYTRSNAEIVLLGTKGKLERKNKGVKQVVVTQVGEHSEKPHEVRKRIERLFGDIPRIELFARNASKGWDAWGNEMGNLTIDNALGVETQSQKSSRKQQNTSGFLDF